MEVYITGKDIRDYFKKDVNKLNILNCPYSLNIPHNIKELMIFFSSFNKLEIKKSNIEKFDIIPSVKLLDFDFLPKSLMSISASFTDSKADISALLDLPHLTTLSIDKKLNDSDYIILNQLKLNDIRLTSPDLNKLEIPNSEKLYFTGESINVQKNITKIFNNKVIHVKTDETLFIPSLRKWLDQFYHKDIQFFPQENKDYLSLSISSPKIYFQPEDKKIVEALAKIFNFKNYDFLEYSQLSCNV